MTSNLSCTLNKLGIEELFVKQTMTSQLLSDICSHAPVLHYLIVNAVPYSPVISQKGKSKNGCFKKTKHANFSEKQTFLTPLIRNNRFSENLACFVFLKIPVLRFAFLPYYQGIKLFVLIFPYQKIFVLHFLHSAFLFVLHDTFRKGDFTRRNIGGIKE